MRRRSVESLSGKLERFEKDFEAAPTITICDPADPCRAFFPENNPQARMPRSSPAIESETTVPQLRNLLFLNQVGRAGLIVLTSSGSIGIEIGIR